MSDFADSLEIIRRPNVRRMRLSVDRRTGQAKLTLPKRAALGPAIEWAQQHKGWIDAQKAKVPAAWPIEPGMTLSFAGCDVTLNWNEKHPRNPKLIGEELHIGGPLELVEARLLRWIKREAQKLLAQETQHYAQIAGVTIGRIGVGDPRTRWGSCSPNGDIRFSWRLMLAPSEVRRATVAHEVAHRIHMDHSPAFHAAVKRIFGRDPKPERAWLRRHGSRIQRFGT